MKNQSLNALIVTSLIWTAISCQSDTNNGTPSQPAVQGTSSGGGDFKYQGARYLLDRASKELAGDIRRASPHIFADLPTGHTQASLATLIEGLKYSETETVSRHGELLGFNYRRNSAGQFELVATKPVMDELASVNVTSINEDALHERLLDLRIRLAHEAAHVMGIGLSRETDRLARVFGVMLQRVLSEDIVICKMPYAQAPANWSTVLRIREAVSQSGPEVVAQVNAGSFYWIFNRVSGRGSFTTPAHNLGLQANIQTNHPRPSAPLFSKQEAEEFYSSGEGLTGELLMPRADRKRFNMEYPYFRIASFDPYTNVQDWKEVSAVAGQITVSIGAEVDAGGNAILDVQEELKIEMGPNSRGRGMFTFKNFEFTEDSGRTIPAATDGSAAVECVTNTMDAKTYGRDLLNPRSEMARALFNSLTLTQLNQLARVIAER